MLASVRREEASRSEKTCGRAAASSRRMVTASSMAVSASSRRPSPDRRFDWLFSDLARSGRNASGRAAASSRRMVTASSIAASASFGRPSPDRRFDWLFSDAARSGRNASGRAAASSRRMVTASLMAARASSRRPGAALAGHQLHIGPQRRCRPSVQLGQLAARPEGHDLGFGPQVPHHAARNLARHEQLLRPVQQAALNPGPGAPIGHDLPQNRRDQAREGGQDPRPASGEKPQQAGHHDRGSPDHVGRLTEVHAATISYLRRPGKVSRAPHARLACMQDRMVP
jgi:hypothetical protein